LSNWPDHTPEPGETPRWWAYAVVGAVIGAILFFAPGNGNWFSSFRLPDMRMPEISLPEVSAPDLRGRAESDPLPPPPTPSVIEGMMTGDPLPTDSLGPVVQPMAFDDCLALTRDMPNADQYAILLEDTADRRVTRFKSPASNLTITCSRSDGTMTMQTN
jgi:pimeloyl-ACP methyl ester carboxylesterase